MGIGTGITVLIEMGNKINDRDPYSEISIVCFVYHHHNTKRAQLGLSNSNFEWPNIREA